MPQKNESSPSSPSSLVEVLEKMAEKDYAFNFDVTMELATSSLRVGTVRVHGKVESAALKKR
jgi:hypothetical protein